MSNKTKQSIDNILEIVTEIKTKINEKKDGFFMDDDSTTAGITECKCSSQEYEEKHKELLSNLASLRSSISQEMNYKLGEVNKTLDELQKTSIVATKADDGSFSVDIDTEHLKDEIADSMTIMIKETVLFGIRAMIEEENKKIMDEIKMLRDQNKDLKERLIDIVDDLAILKIGGTDLKEMLENKTINVKTHSNDVYPSSSTTTTTTTSSGMFRNDQVIPSYLYKK